MFLAQALSADGSYQQVVDDAMVKRVISGREPGKTNTGGYCTARARRPLTMIATRARQAGAIIAEGAASWWHWRGRPGRRVDGTPVALPDTKENQAAYSQASSQKAGLGFPLCRLVALLGRGSGAVTERRTGSLRRQGQRRTSGAAFATRYAERH